MINTLIVDDSKETLEVLSLNLRLHPYIETIWTAQTAKEAMQICRTANIDLVSLDIHLGNESGFELCKKIRRDHPQIFITMCSMECDPEFMHYATQCGSHYFLAKPVSLNELNLLVNKYTAFRKTNKKASPNGSTDLLQILNMAKAP